MLVCSSPLTEKSAMNHTLFLNLAIVLAVLLTLLVTGDPLALFALLMLHELPIQLAHHKIQAASDAADDDDSKPIGFTADVK